MIPGRIIASAIAVSRFTICGAGTRKQENQNVKSIEKAIEEKIKEAMARGEFDNLAGSGKPLDLSAYFDMPEDLRMGFAMLKSNDFVPEEVELFREIADLEEKASASTSPDERNSLSIAINEKRLALTLLLDRRRRKR